MDLNISIRKKLPHFDLDVSFSCRESRLLVLVGPSGAGKTTIIRILAGLDRPDEGRIIYNGETWVDTDKKIFLPPQKRQVGYVFQEYTLFPHLTVAGNVAFAADDKGNVSSLLQRFNIGHLKDRKPDKISGGERQRCAICQAMARRPRLLLLDEPFSALDAVTRQNLREELRKLKRELSIPVIHVTHDIAEALYLGDDVLPMVSGRIVRKWMVQFMLKGRLPEQERVSEDLNGFDSGRRTDLSVLYDSLEVLQ
ncbi:MAG TPA: ATP-binding cassette domain-containing protein [Deltaproteobacteria bacterium]|nr:ATP-binding cassette domain-containing protein [Deltaproteobacteria bacterium]